MYDCKTCACLLYKSARLRLAEDKHTSFFNPPVESTRCIYTRRIQRRGSLPLNRLANLPRFVLRLLFKFFCFHNSFRRRYFSLSFRDGLAIVRTCKLLFFYMQKSAIASPIRLLNVAKKTSGLLVFSLVLLAGFVRSGATD